LTAQAVNLFKQFVIGFLMEYLYTFIAQTGPVAKVVLLVLLIMSIISWTIILEKARRFRKINKDTQRFKKLFRMQAKFEDIYSQSRKYHHSPFARIYQKNYHLLKAPQRSHESSPSYSQAGSPQAQVLVPFLNARFETAISEEMTGLEKYLNFLATTVSASPFFGLFGTVWGIMTAFLNIGLKGSAEIATIGPGIAEALITTAAGLAVAIPAVIAYNYFLNKLHRMEKELDHFFSNLVMSQEIE
jgi:biopolymer transport protein TolQ